MPLPTLDQFRVRRGQRLHLDRIPTAPPVDAQESQARRALARLLERMSTLQERLYAEGRRALLVILQGMDTSGKDSTIKRVFGAFGPQGCIVTGFRTPTEREWRHDYLWRIHQHIPAAGMIGIFNRSHYESVVVERVKRLVPTSRWRKRFAHINGFERMLRDEGVAVIKFFLHISRDYQKRQLEDRLTDPRKHWKFNPSDLAERGRWHDYTAAFEEALSLCSTPEAPWYIVPAEKKWFRDYLVARAVCEALEAIHPRFPPLGFDPATVRIE